MLTQKKNIAKKSKKNISPIKMFDRVVVHIAIVSYCQRLPFIFLLLNCVHIDGKFMEY
jgi:hypothetical protein